MSRPAPTRTAPARPPDGFFLEHPRYRLYMLFTATGLVVALDQSSVLLSGMTWLDRHFLQRDRFENETAVVERLETNFKRLEFLETRL